jgi:predicted ATP-binding protein involved in virulence
MHIEELRLENYKGFEQKTFTFNPGFNVIIGKNASGKTSLLDAVSIAVSGYITGLGIINTKNNNFEFALRLVTIHGQPKPQIPLKINAVFRLQNERVTVYHGIRDIYYDDRKDAIQNIIPQHEWNTDKISAIASENLRDSRKVGTSVKFPIIAYYGTGRLWQSGNLMPDFKQAEGVYNVFLDWHQPTASSNVFLSWFKTYEDEVNKFQQPEDILFLNVLKAAITSVIPKWTDMAFSAKDNDLMGIYTDEEGNISRLPFSCLSDGYRNVIGMVADIAYRCIQLNPGLGEKVLLDTEGIVLIDEIDLHLHPEWQRNIVADLKKTFPRIQFIATTHSPFIVQSLSKDELIILDKNAEVGEDPWRKSVEEIATDEMQVHDMPRSSRFAEMNKLAKEYFTLLKQNDNNDTLRANINAAKQKLDYIRTYYSDDPAYVAMLEIELNKSEANATRNKD